MSEPRLGCGAAIVVDGRILLVRRLKDPEAGCWGLPGGKVDLYEETPAAAVREIAEELGVVIRAERLLCVADHIDPEAGLHWVCPIYLAETFEGEPRLMEPDKHAAIGWFALEALPGPLTTVTVAAVRALKGDKGAGSFRNPSPLISAHPGESRDP
jgi:ADP-ribose pyrophosphatase YjhB (NUDIX family)